MNNKSNIYNKLEKMYSELDNNSKKYYFDILNDLYAQVKKKKKRRLFVRVFLISVLTIFFLGGIKGLADIGVFNFFFKNSDEVLIQQNVLKFQQNVFNYTYIKDVEKAFDIIIPKIKELPLGYIQQDINVYTDYEGNFSKIFIYYSNGDKQISYVVSNLYTSEFLNIEKSDYWIEVYKVNDITVYFTKNDYWSSAIWYEDGVKYEIYGDLSIYEIKDMINSIYE